MTEVLTRVDRSTFMTALYYGTSDGEAKNMGRAERTARDRRRSMEKGGEVGLEAGEGGVGGREVIIWESVSNEIPLML